MAEPVVGALRAALSSPDAIRLDAFGIVRQLTRLVNEGQDAPENAAVAQELVLRALNVRDQFASAVPILDDLLRHQGLFPYLEPDELTFSDRVAYELHRPDNLGDEVVFHASQARVYGLLMEGRNVILSAPTSYGKSLIIDAIVASGRYNNLVIVVPTIALIDETRRRLFDKFGSQYKITTHLGQERGARNIFVLTQERVVEFADLDPVDFFVIDEFYKLDPRSDPERANLLNQALYRLLRTKAQFYLLGPSIQSLPEDLTTRLECTFLRTDFATVVTEMYRVPTPRGRDNSATLVGLCQVLDDPTLIYCASPASTRRVATSLLAGGVGRVKPELEQAVSWAAEQFHPDWTFVKALEQGIGIHHGRLPRSLGQFVVRAFNEGLLDFLICTSTLIEGVNTKAKNVIIYDHKIARKNVDFFTFNNIRGRSGRMGHHVIGRVYLFNDPPQEDFPEIDVPLLTQDANASDSLLIQLDDADLTDSSRERMRSFREQAVLDLSVLRANRGIDPLAQLALATEIADEVERYHPLLRWSGPPSYDQLLATCELVWEFLVRGNQRRAGVSSGRQLAYKIGQYRQRPDVRAFVAREVAEQADDPDEAVEGALEFLRYWVSFNYPRYLMALDRIQRSVFGRMRLPPGDYSMFATQVENCFVPAGIAALEEYGIPLQVGQRLSAALGEPGTLDSALAALRTLRIERIPLAPFERALVDDARRFI